MQYRGLTLDTFQTEAITHLSEGSGVIVSAPTGTGKTLVADWLVDRALSRGKQVFYTAPVKALSNQKFRDYTRLHGEDHVGLVTGDLVIRREAPCLVMTTEILRNMLLDGETLHNLDAVIIDEAHYLDDPYRGTVWEEVLLYLPAHVTILALSATLPNLQDFADWLSSVRHQSIAVIRESKRTIPLELYLCSRALGVLEPDAFYQAAKHVRKSAPKVGHPGRHGRKVPAAEVRLPPTQAFDVFKAVQRAGALPMLYFVFSRANTERFAYQLAFRHHVNLLDDHARKEVERRIRVADLGPAMFDEFYRLLLSGIAFHHAGMHVHCKTLVEELYEARLIQVLFCTTTFALGINMPARTVALHELNIFDGTQMGPLRTREFMQMAGRAGRRGLDHEGYVIIRMEESDLAENKPVIERLRESKDEPVRSSFSLSYNSIVRLLERQSLERVRDLVARSFLAWASQQKARTFDEQADKLEQQAQTDPRKRNKRTQHHIASLRASAAEARDRCWVDLLARHSFLQRIGYLSADDQLLAGGKVLRHLHSADILLTEIVLAGLLEDLGESQLFGLLLVLSADVPRAVSILTRAKPAELAILAKIEPMTKLPIVLEATRLSRNPLIWSPELFPIGRLWADGAPLQSLLQGVSSPTDYAGGVVHGLRRAKELLTQLIQVYEEMPLGANMRALLKRISRDEVEVVS